MKKYLVMLMCGVVLLAGCGSSKQSDKTPTTPTAPDVKEADLIQFSEVKSGDTLAVMETNKGVITIRLFPELAPKAVENFTTHAKDGYFDNVSFHRVIKDFMIQGGDPEGSGRGGESIWGKPFEDEFNDQLYNFRGAISMANAGPNTNGSQFFIVQQKDGSQYSDDVFKQMDTKYGYTHADLVKKKYQEVGGTPHLDHKHTVFGQVVEGMDIVDAIALTEVDNQDKPIEDVVISNITIKQAE